MALSELSIRGDFRTTVEYLIKLLESDAFVENRVDTGWLDDLIVNKVQSEKPDVTLSLMCASLHISDQALTQAFSGFQHQIEK